MKAEVRNASGKLTESVVTDNADGTYDVEYTPYENGRTPPPPSRVALRLMDVFGLTGGVPQASTASRSSTTTPPFPKARSGCRCQRGAIPAGWWLLAPASWRV